MANIVVHPVSGEVELDALVRRSHGRTKFTFAVQASEAGFSGRQLCVITVPYGAVDSSEYYNNVFDWPTVIVAIAASTTRGRITTIDSRVTLDPIIDLENPIDISSVIEAAALTITQKEILTAGAVYGRKLPPATSGLALEAILSLAGDDRRRVQSLVDQLRGRPIETGARGSALLQQRDAVMFAAEVFGTEQVRPVLRSYATPVDSSAPFLAGLDGITHQLEDAVVSSDARNFLSWAAAEEVHASVMTFREGDRALTIVNANKAPLERLTGADLIYFNHRTRSYVFVQYKMMNRTDTGWRYRPDDQFAAEHQRLRSIQDAHDGSRPADLDVDSYRLSEAVTYFKFCKRDAIFDASDTRLIPGYYVADEYLELHLLAYPGPLGGRQVTAQEIAPRALHGAGFARLIAAGLIGTRISTSEELSRLLQASLSGDRSVVFAMETGNPNNPVEVDVESGDVDDARTELGPG